MRKHVRLQVVLAASSGLAALWLWLTFGDEIRSDALQGAIQDLWREVGAWVHRLRAALN